MEDISMDMNSATNLINNIAESDNFDINAITNAFRYFRNFCSAGPEAQDKLIQELDILNGTKKILRDILTAENVTQEQILCLRVGLQFLGNSIVSNKKNQQKLWVTSQDFLEACLKFKDQKVQNCSAMIFYNIVLGNSEFLNELKHPFENLYELTLNENTSEFAVFALEVFILKCDYVRKFYDDLKPESKLIILDVIKSLITERNNQTIQPEIIRFFSMQFTEKSDLILKTNEISDKSLCPLEIVKILELLVAFSSDDRQCYLKIVQQEKSLLVNCVMLLKSIHLLSKQSGNNFSMITKISEMNELESATSAQENPVFGFKCSLIRLIGNFCWENEDNQNKVRELEGIPVLLDCCNIDGKNPFIIQWCVLAIHNLCEKNLENQKVIESLSNEGKIDSAKLQELGIRINVDENGDSLCIAPLK